MTDGHGTGTQPAATTPPIDIVASTPAAITGRVSATLVLLAVAAFALVGSHRFAAIRSRPRN
jgi:hypothetical protein